MEFIILGLLAFAGFKFFRHTTRAGAEAVRAYVFLEMLNKGMSSQAANVATDALLEDPAADEALNAVNMAKQAYRELHEGKQLPMIGYAYSQGMTTSMPAWYRNLAANAPITFPIEACYVLGRHQAQQERKSMAHDEGYQKFYHAYANEFRRLAGAGPDEITVADLWDREPLYEAYRSGVDPLYVAASTCDEHKQTKETFGNFESYFEAFLKELARYARDAATFQTFKRSLDASGVQSAYSEMMHPRRAAYGYYRAFLRQRQV